MLRKMIFCFLGTMSIACAAEGDAFEQGTVKDMNIVKIFLKASRLRYRILVWC